MSVTDPAIVCAEVTVRVDGREVLSRVSFALPQGAFLVLLGPNGGGKTMLLRTLLGLVPLQEGKVSLLGRSPNDAQGLVGYVPQFARFQTDIPMTARALVRTGLLKGLRLGWRSTAEEETAVTRTLELVECLGLAERQVTSLSGGQMQRVLIARALVSNPQLLFLDEPTASLDLPSGQTFFDELRRLAEGRTVVLVSHDIGVVAPLATHIACLNRELHFHESSDVPGDVLEKTYGHPLELVIHAHSHRVVHGHQKCGHGGGHEHS